MRRLFVDMFLRFLSFTFIVLALSIPFSQAIIFQNSTGTVNFEYDGNGNLIFDGTYYYEYNGFNQLAKVRLDSSSGDIIEEYVYDSNGQRLLKKEYGDFGVRTTTYIGKDYVSVQENSAPSVDEVYYYLGDLLVGKEIDGEKKYYHSNHLGSTDVVTDENGSVVERYAYYPFGVVREGEGERFGFTGQEVDFSGLSYYGARYYDSVLRQFTQPDSIIPELYNSQALNRYAYTYNNPVKYVDPNGHWAITYQVGVSGGLGATTGTFKTGIFVVINDYTGAIQVGTIDSTEGSAGLSTGLGGNFLIGGSVNNNINDYTEIESSSSQSYGGRFGIATSGLEYTVDFTDLDRSGYSIYYSPGVGGEIKGGVGTNFNTHLLFKSTPHPSKKAEKILSDGSKTYTLKPSNQLNNYEINDGDN